VKRLGSGKWQARFPKGGGTYRSRNFDRKGDADRWLRELNLARDRGEWVDPRRGKTPFGEVAEDWFTTRDGLAESTKARDRSYLDSLILPAFGAVPIGQITAEHIEDWMGGLGKAPATVHKAFQIVSGVFKRAVRRKLIATNPCALVDGLPRIEESPKRFLTVSEVGQLADACGEWESLIWLAATSGMRWEEIVGLRWKNISGNTIRVVEVVVEVGGRLIVKGPKTKRSRRSITVPEGLVGRLKGDDYVFCDSEGGPLRRSNWMPRVFQPAVDATVGEPMTFHDLRRTHVAWLIESGVHPKVISDRVGHASIKITMDLYGHLMEGLDASAADAIEDLIAS
jgi:integrase